MIFHFFNDVIYSDALKHDDGDQKVQWILHGVELTDTHLGVNRDASIPPCAQVPCRGCGEHMMLTEQDLMAGVDFTSLRLWCFRCKRRREAEAAAARGQIQ